MTEQYKKTLAGNFGRLYENIKQSGKDVLVVAASKTVDPEVLNFAAANFGLTDIGENRVQELLEKYDRIDKDKLKIHFIGNLQKNKVKYIVGKVVLIHSLDSESLALEIEKQSAKLGVVSDVLIEVNIGNEENKSGTSASDALALAERVMTLSHLRLRGMMTIGPRCESKEEYKTYFNKTYSLFSEIFIDKLPKNGHNIERPLLSMGMSDSYEAALECGANVIRPGQCLFGARQYAEETK